MDASGTLNRITSAGLRVTRQRVVVLEAIAPGEHIDVDTVLLRARDRLRTVSTQAVHDALRALYGAGLVRCVEPAGYPARYEIRVADNHHHLVCRSCGMVVDIDCATGDTTCLDARLPHGFIVDKAEVTWWGYCRRCARARRQGPILTSTR